MSSPIPLEGNAFAERVNETVKRVEQALVGETNEIAAWALFSTIMQTRAIHMRVEDLQEQYAGHVRKHGD